MLKNVSAWTRHPGCLRDSVGRNREKALPATEIKPLCFERVDGGDKGVLNVIHRISMSVNISKKEKK
jgi:hypothetical protein